MGIEMKEFKVHAPGGVRVVVAYEVSEIVSRSVGDHWYLPAYAYDVSDRVQAEINRVPGANGWSGLPPHDFAGGN